MEGFEEESAVDPGVEVESLPHLDGEVADALGELDSRQDLESVPVVDGVLDHVVGQLGEDAGLAATATASRIPHK